MVTINSALSSHSAHCYAEASYSTFYSALTAHSALSTLFPTRNSELGTLHSLPHSALSTFYSALRKGDLQIQIQSRGTSSVSLWRIS
uniref:Uncharacterized protein n=1 Tax=Desertifilum tharense IPPAS B-1220 TaxID=1781255 RepID=A0ACD5GTB9_9CYAN